MTGLLTPRNIALGLSLTVASAAAVYGYQAWAARPSSLPPTEFVPPPASHVDAKQDDGGDGGDGVFADLMSKPPSFPERPPSPEVD